MYLVTAKFIGVRGEMRSLVSSELKRPKPDFGSLLLGRGKPRPVV